MHLVRYEVAGRVRHGRLMGRYQRAVIERDTADGWGDYLDRHAFGQERLLHLPGGSAGSVGQQYTQLATCERG
jgi:hypothetical protein